MDHCTALVLDHRRFQEIAITHVSAHRRGRNAGNALNPIENFGLTVAEIVINDDRISMIDQLDARMRADVARAARNHDRHFELSGEARGTAAAAIELTQLAIAGIKTPLSKEFMVENGSCRFDFAYKIRLLPCS